MAIATDWYSPELLSSLTESLDLATECVPTIQALQPPSDGLSLFDVKNELLLSYVQNLVFLILFKLRNHTSPNNEDGSNTHPSHDDIVKNLVSLRLYLEKGVRPLESRLKYQLDKLLLAASEADSIAPQASSNGDKGKKKSKRASASASEDEAESDSEPEDNHPPISDLSHRPNLSAFTRPTISSSSSSKPTATTNPKIYKPPRITPTAPPPPSSTPHPQSQSRKRKPNHLLDAFVTEELSTAPVAEMSIGAGAGLRGREAERERERREYEEGRLVRLPEDGRGKKRRGGGMEVGGMGRGGAWDEVVGGGAGEGLGEAVRGGKGKRRRVESGGLGRRMGEMWEERKRRGVKGLSGGKRR